MTSCALQIYLLTYLQITAKLLLTAECSGERNQPISDAVMKKWTWWLYVFGPSCLLVPKKRQTYLNVNRDKKVCGTFVITSHQKWQLSRSEDGSAFSNVCLFVCQSVCQHDNSWTVSYSSNKFSGHHPIVEKGKQVWKCLYNIIIIIFI